MQTLRRRCACVNAFHSMSDTTPALERILIVSIRLHGKMYYTHLTKTIINDLSENNRMLLTYITHCSSSAGEKKTFCIYTISLLIRNVAYVCLTSNQVL